VKQVEKEDAELKIELDVSIASMSSTVNNLSIASMSSTVNNGARAKTRGFESELDVSIASMSSTVNNGARGKSEACTKFALWQTVLRKHTTTTTITNSQTPTQSRTHRSAA
jgi:hypothetical protein